MTRTSTKKKTSPKAKQAVDLERVRNNQRRCRARQKEYIASLERRLDQFERLGVDGEANHKLEQLAAENKLLTRLLHSLGLRDEFLEAYRNAAQVAPELSLTSLATQSRPHTNIGAFPSLPLDAAEGCAPDTSDALQVDGVHSEGAQNTPDALPSIQSFAPSPCSFLDLHTTSPAAEHPAVETLTDGIALAKVSETTSLCSWAFPLVLRNNAKGYSAADLDLKLGAGYRFGPGLTDDCRVDNRILLSVLAEVW